VRHSTLPAPVAAVSLSALTVSDTFDTLWAFWFAVRISMLERPKETASPHRFGQDVTEMTTMIPPSQWLQRHTERRDDLLRAADHARLARAARTDHPDLWRGFRDVAARALAAVAADRRGNGTRPGWRGGRPAPSAPPASPRPISAEEASAS
jgi:hypothetical protein